MRAMAVACAVAAALAVAGAASACEVRADVRSFSKDEFNILHVVFVVDARCDRGGGCSGELAYEVLRRGDGRESRSTGAASWSASQSGSASAQAEVPMLPGEEVTGVYVTSVTCR